ncbi:MAG: phosphopantetheine-binding protein [Dermatophilaceae bacterium]
MAALPRDEIRSMMAEVLSTQGKAMPTDDGTDLESIGFRSLDFSELALRVEDEIGAELNFDAPELRQIRTVADVLDFLDQLQQA